MNKEKKFSMKKCTCTILSVAVMCRLDMKIVCLAFHSYQMFSEQISVCCHSATHGNNGDWLRVPGTYL